MLVVVAHCHSYTNAAGVALSRCIAVLLVVVAIGAFTSAPALVLSRSESAQLRIHGCTDANVRCMHRLDGSVVSHLFSSLWWIQRLTMMDQNIECATIQPLTQRQNLFHNGLLQTGH